MILICLIYTVNICLKTSTKLTIADSHFIIFIDTFNNMLLIWDSEQWNVYILCNISAKVKIIKS